VTELKRVLSLIFTICALVSFANAQKAEIAITLNEQFFDALLDAIFQYTAPPEFPIGKMALSDYQNSGQSYPGGTALFGSSFAPGPPCNESVRLLRETNGTKTSVRLRDGRITAPIAFSGSYNPPFVGCVDFAGIAETNIDIEFDANAQRLIGRAKISSVVLNGSGGIGGSLIARMVQGSLDKKINPLEIIKTDKLSFVVPVQNSGSLKMKATGLRHEIGSGSLNIFIAYEFQKGP
jgi:hypothetical protein